MSVSAPPSTRPSLAVPSGDSISLWVWALWGPRAHLGPYSPFVGCGGVRCNHVPGQTERHYVTASRWFTFLWGVIAIIVACTANLFDNLIQLVNIIGSIFYGNILGVFLLAFFVRFVKATATFWAAILTQVIIIVVWYIDLMPYLWLNVVGALLVMILAVIFQGIRGIDSDG